MDLSVIVPVFNEAQNLHPLYEQLQEALDASAVDYEIIAIDDGSRDDSFVILKELHEQDPSLKVIRFRRNYGQTAAFAAGFDLAQGDVVITMDLSLIHI